MAFDLAPLPRLRGRGPERVGLVPGVGGAAPLRLRGRLGLGGPVRLLGLLALPVVGHLVEEQGELCKKVPN